MDRLGDDLEGAVDGGGGGGAGGGGADEGGGGGACAGKDEAGLREETGGGGGLRPDGGGGGPRGGVTSGEDCTDLKEKVELGLDTGFGGGFRKFDTRGFVGCDGADSVVFGTRRKVGSFGAVGGFEPANDGGGLGVEMRELSGSEMYDESRLAPVSMPPLLLSFGMPPAKMPPSCGAVASPPLSPLPPLPPVSLLLRARMAPGPFGIGGASPPGGLPRPGIAGAPPIAGAAEPPLSFPIMGADRSFVTAFLSLAPLVISLRRAPYSSHVSCP